MLQSEAMAGFGCDRIPIPVFRVSVHNPDSDRIFMKCVWFPIGFDFRIESPGLEEKSSQYVWCSFSFSLFQLSLILKDAL